LNLKSSKETMEQRTVGENPFTTNESAATLQVGSTKEFRISSYQTQHGVILGLLKSIRLDSKSV